MFFLCAFSMMSGNFSLNSLQDLIEALKQRRGRDMSCWAFFSAILNAPWGRGGGGLGFEGFGFKGLGLRQHEMGLAKSMKEQGFPRPRDKR